VRFIVLTVAAVATVGALAAGPATGASAAAPRAEPTIAAETDYAVAATPSASVNDNCVSYTGVKACFEKYGDKIWVLDTAPDGYRADGAWHNDLWNGSSWVDYRLGTCRNTLGSGRWGYCNKDFYEDDTLNAKGGRGSAIMLWACDEGPCSADIWIRNDA
jgi:hypothetical protein